MIAMGNVAEVKQHYPAAAGCRLCAASKAGAGHEKSRPHDAGGFLFLAGRPTRGDRRSGN